MTRSTSSAALRQLVRAGTLLASGALAATVALGVAPIAVASTIEEMVENTGAMESPFWRQLYQSGFGYLDAQRVNADSKIICMNRRAGVLARQITPLVEARGYTEQEAAALVSAESRRAPPPTRSVDAQTVRAVDGEGKHRGHQTPAVIAQS